MITIKFDESAVNWCKDQETNHMYLIQQKHWFEDLFKHRGYIYLNQIYEALGVRWDSTKENVLWIYGQDIFCFGFKRFGDLNKWIVTIDR